MSELRELVTFMNGTDRATLAKLVCYFSLRPSLDAKARYLHPRELKPFWESLSEAEKVYYREAVEEELRVRVDSAAKEIEAKTFSQTVVSARQLLMKGRYTFKEVSKILDFPEDSLQRLLKEIGT